MTVIAAKPRISIRPAWSSSTIAAVGVCGYLVGLALPPVAPLDLPLIFLVVLAIAAAVAGVRQPGGPSLAAIPVLGFVAARLLSALMAPPGQRSLQLLAPLLPALLLFVVAAEWIETPRQIAAIYVCLALAGLVLAAALLAGAWRSDGADAEAWARAASTPVLVVKNDVAVIAVLAPLALTVAALRPRPLVLTAVAGFLTFAIVVIVLVQSRTALLTLGVAIAAFAALAGRRALARQRRGLILMLVGLAALAVAADALLGFRLLHKVTHDWHGSGRLALWLAAVAMFQTAPMLGHGPGAYALEARAHLDALQLPAWIGTEARAVPWAHNLYLELAAEQGVVGLLAFLALSGVGLVHLARLVRSGQHDLKLLGAGAGAAFIAFLAAACFELSFRRIWVTVVLFTLLGLLTAVRRIDQRGNTCESH